MTAGEAENVDHVDSFGTFGLNGKRAVVTGASKGIGRGLAVGLAAHGADVVLVARDRVTLEETAAACKEARSDVNIEIYECDIRDTDQIRHVADEMCANEIADILINNAGLNIRTPALQVSDAEWQTIIDTDLRGAFFFAQQIGKYMVEQQRGSIVNISSVGGHVALRTGVVYAAAKAGVIQMTKVLAMEWGKYNVRVNGIAPWYFKTPLTEKLLNDPAYLSEIVSRTPLGRVGDVSELIGPTVFLASDASSYVTGHTIFVDGGMSIFGF